VPETLPVLSMYLHEVTPVVFTPMISSALPISVKYTGLVQVGNRHTHGELIFSVISGPPGLTFTGVRRTDDTFAAKLIWDVPAGLEGTSFDVTVVVSEKHFSPDRKPLVAELHIPVTVASPIKPTQVIDNDFVWISDTASELQGVGIRFLAGSAKGQSIYQYAADSQQPLNARDYFPVSQLFFSPGAKWSDMNAGPTDLCTASHHRGLGIEVWIPTVAYDSDQVPLRSYPASIGHRKNSLNWYQRKIKTLGQHEGIEYTIFNVCRSEKKRNPRSYIIGD